MRTYIALLITVIWAISYISSVVTNDFTAFEASTPVMLVAATFLLGSDIIKRGKHNGS